MPPILWETLAPRLQALLTPLSLPDSLRDKMVQVLPTDNGWLALPALCCAAAGGHDEAGITLTLAVALASSAASLLDDVQDGDFSTERWGDIGVSQATNVSLALVLAGPLVLKGLASYRVPTDVIGQLIEGYLHTGLMMVGGQYRGLSFPASVTPLSHCWDLAEAKTASFAAWCCEAGASLGQPRSLEAYRTFGHHVGLLHQLVNDYANLHTRRQSDTVNLPIAYALTVASVEQRESLSEALETGTRDARSVESLLNDLGFLTYLQLMSAHHASVALQSLAETEGAPEPLEALACLVAGLQKYAGLAVGSTS